MLGYDEDESKKVEFEFYKRRISELCLGCDEIYSFYQAKGVGVFWSPISLVYEGFFDKNDIKYYLILNFNGITADNEELFEFKKTDCLIKIDKGSAK
ncbi:hypothetical protein [Myroides indicus]|uniref:Uncharacterized protein n=1 Tax=Myroides indicus TaxID=1323422 RepID=A0A4R7F0R0_9FLAO|nr:hypothetical protein [Myroides indicus]TDS56537.1 hypothetical protein C8P70_12030 [Myroides indicus]